MGTLIVEGIVPSNFHDQTEFYLQICKNDQGKASKFFNNTNTTLRSNSIAVRKKEFVKKCRAGDRVRLTIEHYFRKDGIRVRAIDCEIL